MRANVIGAGKTVMFSYMVSEHLKRGGKALIVTDRIELMKQSDGAFAKIGLNPELIQAGKSPWLDSPLHVAMVETLYRRAAKYAAFLMSRTMIIFDECHKSAFDKLFPYLSSDTVVIGATATPLRQGGQAGLDSFYQDLVQPIDTPDLIAQGFLADAITYGVDMDLSAITKRGGDYDLTQLGSAMTDQKVYDGVIENYQRICPGTKALLFAPDIASSKRVVSELNAAGIPAMHLDCYMTTEERARILHWFKTSPGVILSNVGILTTGFDCPDIQTVILYRATTSLPLFLQMCGRGSRPHYPHFYLLDFGNNIKTHGHWQMPRTWSLAKKKRKGGIGVAPVKECPKCGALVPATSRVCNTPVLGIPCGHIFQMTEKEEEEREVATLRELPFDLLRDRIRKADFKELEMIKEARGYKQGWVWRLIADEELEEYANFKGYRREWVERQLEVRKGVAV